MTDKPIDLDKHRGMAAQQATDLRRLVPEIEANRLATQKRQEELEHRLVALPAADWLEAAQKARYVLGLFDTTAGTGDARIRTLIEAVLADFDRLSSPK